ncbi:unnamed protein product [Gongylonema pulchrum]|uniref:EB domain-containing protein n=1 Tax=Gongylonema pulchrum TaxID=637853 RepID=A0A183DK18_9BILA|nr:unnamed protein product [Gongylonema pulchrum]
MQCSGNSICANGFCTCPSGERVISGVCAAVDSQGAPGEVCEPGYTKCTGGSICVDHYCKCLSNQFHIKSGFQPSVSLVIARNCKKKRDRM